MNSSAHQIKKLLKNKINSQPATSLQDYIMVRGDRTVTSLLATPRKG
jgi:hypothetical protein